MSSSRTTAVERDGSEEELVAIRVDTVRTCWSWPRRALQGAHVDALVETPTAWPPIVVTRDGTTVVDGLHRLAAAKKLGLRTIPAVLFDGSAEDAYVEFVRGNNSHGLPLTIGERREAAQRLLECQPSRSDRSIAEICALAPSTVGRIRYDSNADGDRRLRALEPTVRTGRDGRRRPTDPGAVRKRIAEEIERHPGASLRSIARTVGASPETVRSVAKAKPDLNSGNTSHDGPTELRARLPRAGKRASLASVRVGSDRAFQSGEAGKRFAALFDRTAVSCAELLGHVECVPLSRVYEVADEARRRAESWCEFAERLESRVRARS